MMYHVSSCIQISPQIQEKGSIKQPTNDKNKKENGWHSWESPTTTSQKLHAYCKEARTRFIKKIILTKHCLDGELRVRLNLQF
jgi:uncharacterized protein YcaQ